MEQKGVTVVFSWYTNMSSENGHFDSKSCPTLLQLLVSGIAYLKAIPFSGCRNLSSKCSLNPRPCLVIWERRPGRSIPASKEALVFIVTAVYLVNCLLTAMPSVPIYPFHLALPLLYSLDVNVCIPWYQTCRWSHAMLHSSTMGKSWGTTYWQSLGLHKTTAQPHCYLSLPSLTATYRHLIVTCPMFLLQCRNFLIDVVPFVYFGSCFHCQWHHIIEKPVEAQNLEHCIFPQYTLISRSLTHFEIFVGEVLFTPFHVICLICFLAYHTYEDLSVDI